jgi:peptidoglycan/LPS O-acetylase OafA/YrhL
MKGSIVVYTTLLALSRLTKNTRLMWEGALVFYFLYIADGWYCAMFAVGMLLCDLDLLAAKDELPAIFERLRPAKAFIFYHLFFFGLYLGGVPSHSRDVEDIMSDRGWHILAWFKPQAVFDYKWFYLFLAATFLVASIPRIPWLRRFFETRFCQHLGRISFALYLVHGPILWTIGDRLYTATGWAREQQQTHLAGWVNKFALPMTGPLGLEISFLAPHIVLLPLTLWMAQVVTRVVDEPAVRFAQALYRRGLAGPIKG